MKSNLVLLASTNAVWLTVVLCIIVAVLVAGGFLIFLLINDKKQKESLGNAKMQAERVLTLANEQSAKITTLANEQAERTLKEATFQSSAILKESRIEAKEEVLKLRSDFEKEIKDRKIEIQKQEQRLSQKEESIDKKEAILDKKNEQAEKYQTDLENKKAELEKMSKEVSNAHVIMLAEIEKAAQLSKEEAKSILIENMTQEARRDAAVLVRDIEEKAKEEGDKKAQEIVSLAIQKCAADHSSDMTVSVIALPNDEMKGRLIGREGRNIRAIENATGVDLIIDDTPEIVVASGFDPIRREVAKITIEKLVADGRIHPARIEETVEKVKRDIEIQIKEAGESAVFDAGIYGIHPELIKLLGRLKFRTSYGQNVLKHSLEVAFIAAAMAGELGVDVNLSKRAGLLHDIGKAVDFEIEGTHIQIGADLAKKFRENKDVVNAIMAHHGEVEPSTIEAILVQAADAISGSRPGARRETMENYVKRLQKLEEIANSFKGIEKSFAIQAGREIRIIVKPEIVDDAQTLFISKEIAKKIESEMQYPGQIKVNVIREIRSVEYAK